jgi:glycosyltransferase involved in cell wall biosynthesis
VDGRVDAVVPGGRKIGASTNTSLNHASAPFIQSTLEERRHSVDRHPSLRSEPDRVGTHRSVAWPRVAGGESGPVPSVMASDASGGEQRLFGLQVANGYSSEAAVFARLLGARGNAYEAQVLFHDDGNSGDDANRFEALARCEVVRFDTGWRRNPGVSRLRPGRLAVAATYVWRVRRVVALARQFAPTVIYSPQQHYDCRAASYISHRLHVPQIIHLHYNVGSWLTRFALNRLRTCEHVIAVSDFTRNEALRHGVAPERITTVRSALEVPPPIDSRAAAAARQSLGIPLDAYVIGMVSRLDPSKGHTDSISAFSAMAAEREDAWLVIVGKGRDEADIHDHAVRSVAARRIVFAGYRSDVPELLGSFNAFLHPSRNEPFGMAILEALAAGLPVVAYDEGGVPEIITSGCDGILVAPGDVRALSEALVSLYEHPALATRLATAARAKVARSFRPEDAARRFADVVGTTSDARRRDHGTPPRTQTPTSPQ